MTREELSELIDVPPELRTEDEAAIVAAAIAEDPEMGRLDKEMTLAMTAFSAAAAPDVSPHLASRLNERLAAENPSVKASPSFTKRLVEFFSTPWVLGPVVAMAALLLIVLPSSETSTTRTRGVGSAPLSVGLQIAVERAGGGLDAAGVGSLQSGDGLIFRIPFEGAARVLLLEEAPDGDVEVIVDEVVSQGVSPLRILDAQGQELAWTPEGGPGQWRYQAIAYTNSAMEKAPTAFHKHVDRDDIAVSESVVVTLLPAAQAP